MESAVAVSVAEFAQVAEQLDRGVVLADLLRVDKGVDALPCLFAFAGQCVQVAVAGGGRLALHKTVQRSVPMTLVSAGLPQIAELAGDAKSYAERLFRFPLIGNLEPDDARRALWQPAQDEGVEFSVDALDKAIVVTGGYP